MTEQQVALVTGANKGIGLAVARGLLELGLTVYLGARDIVRGEQAAATLAAAGLTAHVVTDPATIGAAAERIAHEQDALDILVNNVGTLVQPVRPPSRTPVAEVRETYETNVLGYNSSKARRAGR